MIETYKMMSQLLLPKYAKMSNEQLCEEYQKTNDQCAFAEMFCRNFKMWCGIAYNTKFYAIDPADKVSVVLKTIYSCMSKFDATKNYKFSTFCTSRIIKAMITQIKRMTALKRSGDTVSLDYIVENGMPLMAYKNEYTDSFVLDKLEFLESLKNSGFTEKELQVCELIIDNPHITNIEIAEQLKTHRHTIAKEKRAIEQKLVFGVM